MSPFPLTRFGHIGQGLYDFSAAQTDRLLSSVNGYLQVATGEFAEWATGGRLTATETADSILGAASFVIAPEMLLARGSAAPAALTEAQWGRILAEEGAAIHGNSLRSPRTAYLYELYQKDGTFLKYGISQDPRTRYSKAFMADKDIYPIASGNRADMLALERQMVIQNPGPLNREPWAVRARGGNR